MANGTVRIPKDARTGKFAEGGIIPKGTMKLVGRDGCVVVSDQATREEPDMAKSAPIEVIVKVEISDEDRELLRMLQARDAYNGGPDDTYFGLGGYGSQDR